jgi:hypothetical protein
MASINGLELKKVTHFKGHEGEPLMQGDVYYNGKKVGYYSDDSWGGPENLEITPEVEAMFKDFCDEEAAASSGLTAAQLETVRGSFTGVTAAISFLQTVMENEKEFTKAAKKGYGGIIIYTHNGGYSVLSIPKGMLTNRNDDQLIEDVVKQVPNLKLAARSDLAVYRDITQFAIIK